MENASTGARTAPREELLNFVLFLLVFRSDFRILCFRETRPSYANEAREIRKLPFDDEEGSCGICSIFLDIGLSSASICGY